MVKMPYLCHTYSLQYKNSTDMKNKLSLCARKVELLTQSTTFTYTFTMYMYQKSIVHIAQQFI